MNDLQLTIKDEIAKLFLQCIYRNAEHLLPKLSIVNCQLYIEKLSGNKVKGGKVF